MRFDEFLHPELKGLIESELWQHICGLLLLHGSVVLAAFDSQGTFSVGEYLEGNLCGLQLGNCIEVPDSLCPEGTIIAKAANRGISMTGTDLFVTSFPRLPWAYVCAYTGIRRLFYVIGQPFVPAIEILHANGVEVIRINR